ncbi:MAG TPA: L,D-transpeptidase family protein [Candidatus Paceibacterota bacterium]|nr:L,D-transpeptidase family protein [Candidatus Paceibacterota bacterium]
MKRLGLRLVGIAVIASIGWYGFREVGALSQRPAAAPTPSPPFIATTTTSSVPEGPTAPSVPLYRYIEIVDSCGPYYDGACVNLRAGPSTSTPVVMKLRDGMVLKVASTTVTDGETWYRIGFDGEIHYPERVTGDWYVDAAYTRSFLDPGEISTNAPDASSTKRIVVDLANETLYAYDGDTLFMQQAISTGLVLTPTPAGRFYVMRKMPDSYMQGPVPGVSDQYYDLPGVPWDLYFTAEGAAIHGAYWHNHFGEVWSHGCVNLPVSDAEKLYEWAPLGTPVIVER